jgi:activator of 2-hydroxyglutaryl-CoA dehydratase
MNKRAPAAYITEIFAHASGVEFLLPAKGLRSAIIDIGGNISKKERWE